MKTLDPLKKLSAFEVEAAAFTVDIVVEEAIVVDAAVEEATAETEMVAAEVAEALLIEKATQEETEEQVQAVWMGLLVL